MTFTLVIHVRNTQREGACQPHVWHSPNERRGVFAKCISAFGGAAILSRLANSDPTFTVRTVQTGCYSGKCTVLKHLKILLLLIFFFFMFLLSAAGPNTTSRCQQEEGPPSYKSSPLSSFPAFRISPLSQSIVVLPQLFSQWRPRLL